MEAQGENFAQGSERCRAVHPCGCFAAGTSGSGKWEVCFLGVRERRGIRVRI